MEHIIAKILAGDINAFQHIITEYQRLVSHIVFRMIKKAADREDISQEIFIKVYQNLSSFKFESKLSTWIARIAYNQCLNYQDKKKVSLYDDLTPDEESFDKSSGENESPEESTEQLDISNRVQVEIEKMPIQFRTILTLYHLDEMSYKEIAEIMEMPEGTVKSYLFRARKLLKRRLTANYTEEELWQ